jgi:hypothetical protein
MAQPGIAAWPEAMLAIAIAGARARQAFLPRQPLERAGEYLRPRDTTLTSAREEDVTVLA